MKKFTKKQLKLIKAFVVEFGTTETVPSRFGGTITTSHLNVNLTHDADFYRGDLFHINGDVYHLKKEK